MRSAAAWTPSSPPYAVITAEVTITSTSTWAGDAADAAAADAIGSDAADAPSSGGTSGSETDGGGRAGSNSDTACTPPPDGRIRRRRPGREAVPSTETPPSSETEIDAINDPTPPGPSAVMV